MAPVSVQVGTAGDDAAASIPPLPDCLHHRSESGMQDVESIPDDRRRSLEDWHDHPARSRQHHMHQTGTQQQTQSHESSQRMPKVLACLTQL